MVYKYLNHIIDFELQVSVFYFQTNTIFDIFFTNTSMREVYFVSYFYKLSIDLTRDTKGCVP